MTTYYVKGNGSDSANGTTLATAFKTLQKAVTDAANGDTVLVDGANGTIFINSESECVLITKNNLTVKGINGTPKIDGKNQWPTPNKKLEFPTTKWPTVIPYTGKALIRVNASNVTIENIEVLNSAGSGIAFGVDSVARTGGLVKNVKVHGIRWQPMSMNYVTNGVIEDSVFYDGGIYCPTNISSDGEYRSGSVHNWSQCVQLDECIDTVCRRCTIYNHWGEGISIPGGRGSVFEDCVVYDCFSTKMYVNRTSDCIYRRNLVYNSVNSNFMRGGFPSNGVSINNENSGNQGDRPAIARVLIENCIFIGNGNNLVFGDQDAADSFTDVTLRNNAFIESVETGSKKACLNITTNTVYTRIKMYNNIFYQTSGDWAKGANAITSQWEWKNNAFFGMSTASLPPAMQGQGAILADPKLVNPIVPLTSGSHNINNYKILNNTSPLINASATTNPSWLTPVDVLGEDYLGATRNGVPDIGPLEFNGTVSNVTANFTATPLSGNAPLVVNFTNTSVNATSYVWYYNNGSGNVQFSALANPTHEFTLPGTYAITLVATGPGGSNTLVRNSYVVVNTVETVGCVNNKLTATYTLSNGGDDRTTNGGVLVDNDVVSRVGDKAATNFDNVTSLTFRNINVEQGESAITATLSFYVVGMDGPTASVKIRGGLSPNATPPTTLADFNSKAKTTATVIWNTGALVPGATATSPNLSAIFTEIFSQAGWSEGNAITLFLEDGQGVGFQSVGMVRFATAEGGGPNPKITLTTTCGTLQSAFTVSDSTPDTTQTVTFTDTSIGDVVSYSWNFGDGLVSNLPNPTHNYPTAGTYFVSLTVIDSLGQTSQSIQQIIVNEPDGGGPGAGTIRASFTADKSSVLVGELITFTDTSTSANGITSWLWDFDDGTYSTVQSPKHSYYNAGTHNIKLTIKGPDGTNISSIWQIEVTNHVPQTVSNSLQLVFYNPETKCYVHMDGAPNINYTLALTANGYAWVPLS